MRAATWISVALVCPLAGCATTAPPTEAQGTAGTGEIALSDPSGDDNGPGNYVYPTDQVYKPGSFDLTGLQVVSSGDTVELRVSVAARIDDPWDSRAWGGNGFSVQMAFVHIDTDHVAGSGVELGLPGTNVRFAPEEAWDRVVIISPQGPTRVNSEIEEKAPQWKDRIVVPRVTRASGRSLVAVVDAAQLGGLPSPSWGFQVLMQSNEGFPAKTDLLTRKVNEYEGQHRFGGGTDYDNDPHVIDILVPPGRGEADEIARQHDILGAYTKEAIEPKPEDLAAVPMVYPQGGQG